MLHLGFWIVAAAAAVALLAVGFKLFAVLVKTVLVLLLLPFHVLAAALALVGGVLLLPILVVAAALVVLGLVGGLVAVPLLPFALLGLGVAGILRLVRPRRSGL